VLRRYRPGDENRIEPPDLERGRWLATVLALWDHYHRYEIVGLHHLPSDGPALIVSHHTLTLIDALLLARRILLRDGRVPRGLTDTLVFTFPALRDLAATIGVVAGTQENALALLRQGQLCACMPGGRLEWSRPWTQRRTLRWGDHRGYARLAIRAQVPIIATACPAADDAYVALFDGWRLGSAVQKLLGLRQVIPFTVGVGLLGPVPLPVKLTQYLAPPIDPEVPPDAADDDEAVARLDARVRATITGLLQRP
jgi:1-acyl-sn-glycerol-3-phosphate acyltransferase